MAEPLPRESRALLSPVGVAFAHVLGDFIGPAFLSATKHARILPLGDSLTVGDSGGYRKPLGLDLASQDYWFDWAGSQSSAFGKHEGHSGWGISALDKQVPKWLAEANPIEDPLPLVVLVLAGTNDVAGNASPALIVQKLRMLIAHLLAHGATSVVVMTLPNFRGKESIIQQSNDAIRKEFSAWNGVRVADIAQVLTDADLAKDGIHLQMSGYKKIANVLGEALGLKPLIVAPDSPSTGPIYVPGAKALENAIGAAMTPAEAEMHGDLSGSSAATIVGIGLAALGTGIWIWRR